jgi:hypothetical protein
MGLDQLMQRLKGESASADLVGQRRYAEINTLPGVSLASLGGHGLSTRLLLCSTGNVRPDAFMLLCVLGIG